MDFEIKVEEGEDPNIQEMSHLLSIIESDELNLEVFSPETEPVIDVPYSPWNDSTIKADPLHTEEYQIVTVEALTMTSESSRLITNRIVTIKTEAEEIDLEPDIEEEMPISDVCSELPETTPCNILLNANEVTRHYALRSRQLKFPSKTQQRKAAKRKTTPYQRLASSISVAELQELNSPIPSSSMSNSPYASPYYQDSSDNDTNSPTNTSEIENNYKTKTCQCTRCDIYFTCHEDLKTHIKSVHNKSKQKTKKIETFACEICDVKYTKRELVRKHYNRKHPEVPKFTCDYCKKPKQFTLKSDLEKHLLLHNISKYNRKRSKPKKYEDYEINSVINKMCPPTKKSQNFKVQEYMCKICNKSVKNRDALTYHYEKVHPDIQKLTCNFCKGLRQYRFKDDVKKHILSFHIPRYFCKICTCKFTKISLLRKHKICSHSNIPCKIVGKELIVANVSENNIKINNIKNVICKICDATFVKYSGLRKHINNKHKIINTIIESNSSDKSFTCKYCNTKFKSHSGIRKHLINTHPEKLLKKSTVYPGVDYTNNQLTCKYCSSNFMTKSGLRRHIANQHSKSIIKTEGNLNTETNKNEIKCNLCNIKFATNSGLKRHNRNLHFDKSNACENIKTEINSTEVSSTEVNSTEVNSTKNNNTVHHIFMCTYCNHTVLSQSGLKKHIANKHLKRPTKNKRKNKCKNKLKKKFKKSYECHICHVGYYDRDSLIKHYRNIHPTLPKLNCDFCNRYFPLKKYLKHHISTIHLKNYECQICNAKFVTKRILQKHKIIVHFNFKCKVIKNKLINLEDNKIKYDFSKIKNRYLCHVCPFGTSGIELLGKHLARTHNISMSKEISIIKDVKIKNASTDIDYNVKLWECEVCHGKVRARSNLKKHIERLHPDHLINYTCNFCDRNNFLTKFDVDNHVIKVHMKSQYQCKLCCIYFKDEITSINHTALHNLKTKNNYNENQLNIEDFTHYCSICNLVFTNEKNYLKHQKNAHLNNEIQTDTKLLICDSCSTCYYSKLHLKKHIKKHLDKLKYKCLVCQELCTSIEILKDHLICWHNDIQLPCPYCDRYYKRLGSHIKSIHLDTTVYKCEYCTEICKGKLELKKHMSEIHTVERFLRKCNLCNDVFSTNKSLKEHKKIIHNEIKPFLCHLCAYDCNTRKLLKLHIDNVHDNNRKIEPTMKCPKCSKYYKQTALNIHISVVHNKNTFKCNICNKIFKEDVSLLQHKYYIHNIGFANRHTYNVGDFECSVCFLKYKFQHTMLKHYNREHVPCVCDICNRELKGKHSMEKHLEYSHGMKEKVYPCKKCKHVALTPGRLQKHLVAIHNKKIKSSV